MIIADTNEFHGLKDGAAYKNHHEADGTYHPILIARATYSSTHEDNVYGETVKECRANGIVMGHYGYMVANVGAAAQGTFFGQVVRKYGGLKKGDAVFCDAEEGTGDQTPRVNAFLNAARAVLHDYPIDEGVYSGAAFWNAHLGKVGNDRIRWIAAYGQPAPIMTHDLWQFEDNRVMAGVNGPCDASIYLGNLADWEKMVGTPPAPSLAPSPAPSSGPTRHVASGGISLRQAATKDNTKAVNAINVSLQKLDQENH